MGSDQLSDFLTMFPSQIHSTVSPHIHVFWSQISSSDDVVWEKIKSAFCNINSSNLNGLIQFWAPVKTNAGRRLLSTSDQPFVLNHLHPCFRKYRLRSLNYHHCIDLNNKLEVDPLIISGPPATAFLNRFPEVVTDPGAYQTKSPLVRFALECEFTSSLFLPVFNPSQTTSCVGVIECCMKHSGLVEIFYHLNTALQIVGLSTFVIQQCQPYKAIPGLTFAMNEIGEAVKTICGSHDILLAHVWIAYENAFLSSLEETRAKRMYGMKFVGYCDNDDDDLMCFIKEYYDTCNVLPLKMGEGLSGKALETYEPHFCRDVFELQDSGLLGVFSSNSVCGCSSLAICLRSIHTGDADYVFEFLWPQSRKYLILLESLLLTLKRCLPSFKFAYGAQLGDELRVVDVENSTGTGLGFFKILDRNRLSQIPKALEETRRFVVEDCISSSTIPSPQKEDVKQQFGRSTNESARKPTASFSTLKRKSNVLGNLELQEPKFVSSQIVLNDEDNRANQEQSANSNSLRCPGNDELIIEAEYGDHRTLSSLPTSSKVEDIKRIIDDNYKLVSGSYKLQFLDFEDEWIRLDDDGDWESCVMSWRIAGTQTIQLRVQLFTS